MDTANVMFVHFHFPRDAFPRGRRLSRALIPYRKNNRKDLPRLIIDAPYGSNFVAIPFSAVANLCREVISALGNAF